MKRSFLLTSCIAATALASMGQYTADPSTKRVAELAPSSVWYVQLSEQSVAELEKTGAKVNFIGVDPDAGRNLWFWNGFQAAPESIPGVDLADGNYLSLKVTGDGGWSGGGYNIEGEGVDLSLFNDDTHFHLAYSAPSGTPVKSLALIILDDEANGSKPAKIAVGESFVDGGAVYSSIGPALTDEWQGIDITLGELKKLWPSFSPANLKTWKGNILSMLGGGEANTNFALDAVYFYNLTDPVLPDDEDPGEEPGEQPGDEPTKPDYVTNPTLDEIIEEGVVTVNYITLGEASVDKLTAAGAEVNFIGTDPASDRNLWIWDGLTGYESAVAGEDGGEALSLKVTGTAGWSGAGFNIAGEGANLSGLNDDTHFHLAYKTPSGVGPESVALILLDGTDAGSYPAKFAVGKAFEDNGAVYPTIGPALTEEWQGVDITFGNLKKIWPSFTLANLEAWKGNSLAFLAGNKAESTFAFDAIYLYNLKESDNPGDEPGGDEPSTGVETDTTIDEIIEEGVVSVDYIVLGDASVEKLTAAGAEMNFIGTDPDTERNFWIWDGLVSYDSAVTGPDGSDALALKVTGTAGWSGAGFNVAGYGINLSDLNDDTHFHLAYKTPSGVGPATLAFMLLDGTDNGSNPAKFAVGTPFNDNGQIYASVGPALTEEWQGIDVTLGYLKTIWPRFTPANLEAWKGNSLAFLAGNMAETTFALDAIYFYNTKGTSAVGNVEKEAAVEFIVTANTVNVLGGNGIQLYNVAGQLVKTTEGTTVGISNLASGIYVARSGRKVQKIIVR